MIERLPMEIKVRESGEVAILEVHGRLTIGEPSEQLYSALQSVLKKGYEAIGDVLEVSFGPLSNRQREDLYRFMKLALEKGEPAQSIGF